jgi:hypothetical protein
MSPELLNPEVFGLKDDCPTRSSDCYALGMVIYEVLSGQVPFAQYRNNHGVATKVLRGGRPERLKEWRGDGSRMTFGGFWNIAGGTNQVIAQVFEMYSFTGSAWKKFWGLGRFLLRWRAHNQWSCLPAYPLTSTVLVTK